MKTIGFAYWALAALLVCGACSSDDTSESVPVRVTTVGITEVWAVQATAVGQVAAIEGVDVAERGFVYAKVGDADLYAGKRVIAEADESATRFEATIPDLEPQTDYRLSAYVCDAEKREIFGTPVNFSTGKISTAKISSPAVKATTAKTAVLSARIVEDGGIPADLFGVEYVDDETSETRLYTIPGAPNYMVRSGEEFSVSIPICEGLRPGTHYRARMYARSNTQEIYTAEFPFQMLEIALPQVESPKQLDEEAGKTDLVLTARLLSDGNDPAVTFGVAYKLDAKAGDTPDDTWTKADAAKLNDDGISYRVHVTGLTVSSKYGVAAYAVNDAGTAYGSVLEVQTQQLASPETKARMYQPTEFDALFGQTTEYNVGADYIYLQAAILQNGGYEFVKCGFMLATNATFEDAIEVEATSIGADSFWVKKTGLESGKRYYYKSFVETSTQERFESDFTASVSTAAIYAKDGKTRLYLLLLNTPGGTGQAATLGPDQNVPLFYYELPPVKVETEGRNYNYYFLDRNLGASKAPTPAQLSLTEFSVAISEYVGYFFQLGREMPSASSDAGKYAASGGLAALTKNYGWNGTNTNTSWDNSADPCPKGYRLPTKEEFDNFMAASDNDIPTARNLLNACVTGIRAAGNGGIAAGDNRYRICFYLTTGIYDLYNDNLNFITNAAQGAPVRCVRIEEIQ